MRDGFMFRTVSAVVFAGALTVLQLQPAAPPDIPAPPDIAATPADEMPAPRTPKPPLPMRLAAAGFAAGDPVFLRILKEEAVLEVWLKRGGAFELFETVPICSFSGGLGPKRKEGDGQSPEGFYEVGRAQLNPNSAYHLAFNLGYPNAYDRALGWTGGFLMVHGNCASIGCYAMTDIGIDDIYALVAAALEHGQRSIAVHIYPFRLSDDALAAHAGSAWDACWANLKEGANLFEASHIPPAVFVCGGRYAFTNGAVPPSCSRIASW